VPTGRIAPWYFAYLILGLLTSGLLPFLLPLMVADISHERGPVAYVAGAYDLGLLGAPLFGKLAEWRDLYRPVFFGGFVVLGLTFAAFLRHRPARLVSVGPSDRRRSRCRWNDGDVVHREFCGKKRMGAANRLVAKLGDIKGRVR
jgi:hypothetical protein